MDNFTVAGKGPFPLDMLRYDCCYPMESGDALEIEKSLEDRGCQKAHTVRLFARSAERRVTDGRWESFRWHVVSMTDERGKVTFTGVLNPLDYDHVTF